MSDRMRPIPFSALMEQLLSEYARDGSVFGVRTPYRHTSGKRLPLLGEWVETPFGPAAGPHTQLAQNLIAAYAGGARFFELKTVQTLDGEDLPVSKPCILAREEGYNVEWSTELTVPQALDEYVKAWFALKLVSGLFGLGARDGFVFNMSVGYDLAGIRSPKLDAFIEGLKNAEHLPVWAECVAWAIINLPRLGGMTEADIGAISPHVCGSITLSTLHGCPPDEIERIATYLLREKGLHTFVKCNPTLLGYDFARRTMDALGYDRLAFDDHHFKADLQMADAVPMFERLLALANDRGLRFGLKLSNTFPVEIREGELPGEEMYMSGKALFPLTIHLARQLEQTFAGKLRVSYSGGADAKNIAALFGAGIWPVTLATTLLKPGGYQRLKPMAEALSAMPYADFDGVDLVRLDALAESALRDARYRRPPKPEPPRKNDRHAPLVDCFLSPCSDGCPLHQDIPAYLELVAQGRYADALAVICARNPLPFITGTICAHRCQSHCTRLQYEESVHIREAKLLAATEGYDAYLSALRPGASRPERVAVIGGGPAGMALSFFLARGGTRVTLFEKRDALGGVVRHAIPAFRIGDEAIARDAALLERLGVEIRLNASVDDVSALLQSGYTHAAVCCGAWRPGTVGLAGELDALEFLEKAKTAPKTLSLGKRVIVVGAGNTAMDCARAAKRLPGVEEVTVVYRRTRHEMPADAEELALAQADGVRFCELLAPERFESGKLTCAVMRLGAADASGRRSPEKTGETVVLPAESVIAAAGERVDGDWMTRNGVRLTAKGRPDGLKQRENVYVLGDALHGPATVAEAIADAIAAAEEILGEPMPHVACGEAAEAFLAKRGELADAGEARDEFSRCLGCGTVCLTCVEVCPNRANIVVMLDDRPQVVHVDGRCNECGNCAIFCPYAGAPYKEKLTFFADEAAFRQSENPGFTAPEDGKCWVRLDGAEKRVALDDAILPVELSRLMRETLAQNPWLTAR